MAWVPNSAARIAGAHIPPRIVPTRASQAVFRAKALVHQIARGIRNRGAGLRRFQKFDGSGLSFVVAQSRTALWSDERLAERAHQLGKVQNLRRAAAALDGILVPAGEVFSFWKQVGRASRRRGFVVGRMLQQGCVVPAVGGGLCQLSNALYETALQAGCEIVERHPHSRVVAGSSAANGRDATVAWNYVDLRFRPRHGLRIAARVTRDDLVIEFHGHPDTAAGVAPALPGAVEHRQTANSCTTCGEIACFRHERARPGSGVAAPAAYLVDENWPEFREFIGARRQPRDVLGLPLDGGRWRLPRYRWDTSGFVRVETATFRAFRRALAMRRLPAQGAIRRQAELQAAEAIARRLSRLLMPEIETVWIAQSLLPFLWRDGNLGGREVRVLMTRLPMHVLQARLDHFWAAHPDRPTLGDFRAPQWIADAEAEALAYASQIVTPHDEIARLFPDRVFKLNWQLPPVPPSTGPVLPRRIAFPGPTIARKGAYEMREAALTLGLDIVLVGSELEGPGFWNGVGTRRPDPAAGSAGWLNGVAAVAQPAFVEDRPRHLLVALAAGVPVIATAACGLGQRNGLTIIPEDDALGLIAALAAALPSSERDTVPS